MPYAAISASSSGANTVVAAVANKRIRVQNYLLVGGGTVTATWKSDTTAISGGLPLVANSVVACSAGNSNPNGPDGVLETAGGAALVLDLSGAVAVSGHIRYEVLS